ncbi:gliding motility-associated ABC transporter ATP-binding subunit GldA [Reichenbachiella versicolor]|uniref:gliding motility-associated ABC transporter ATP-binding subunit GldA n=1 Tax=Reichenbachiella versicolor TaxID=1821036 RepID=UPI000D6E5474|nr:gliding motility-associated ABC transporter ATP-binding subunit GldA [Reichenbachiella versicolor]
MSLVIQNLTKIYGQQYAVDDISFSVQKGEILGFLGPNGAGKSTTMKIATGYLSPSMGSVKVADIDVIAEPLMVQAKVGYLPEHNPLYLDMYVHEFLSFTGKANKLSSKQIRNRIPEVVEQCGLIREQNKKIGQLSKGYRQRVGLAQALLHDPEVLILDEPTTGLDPNQILEIRKLIKDVSKDKTVIFSSHIMQEIKALCDRVVVINKGKLIADNTIDEFEKGFKESQVLIVEFKSDISESLLKGVATVDSVTRESEGKYALEVTNSEEARSEVFQLAATNNLPLVGLQEEVRSLEDIFQSMTLDQ